MKFTEVELFELEDLLKAITSDFVPPGCPRDVVRRLIEHARRTGAVEPIPDFPDWCVIFDIDPNAISLMGCIAAGGRRMVIQRIQSFEPSSTGDPKT